MPIKKNTIRTLKKIRETTAIDALMSGRYKSPFTEVNFIGRDKSKAFRCMAYNGFVINYNAIDDAIKYLEKVNSEPAQKAQEGKEHK